MSSLNSMLDRVNAVTQPEPGPALAPVIDQSANTAHALDWAKRQQIVRAPEPEGPARVTAMPIAN